MNKVNLENIEYIRKVLTPYEFTFIGDALESEGFFSCHVRIDNLIYRLVYIREWDVIVVNSTEDQSGVFASGMTEIFRSYANVV